MRDKNRIITVDVVKLNSFKYNKIREVKNKIDNSI